VSALAKAERVAAAPSDERGQSAAAPMDAVPVEIARMFTDLDGLRQAVLLYEILRRPEERWQ
jgi:hypothetical protein